jgi:hypothetical protein
MVGQVLQFSKKKERLVLKENQTSMILSTNFIFSRLNGLSVQFGKQVKTSNDSDLSS